MDASLEQFMKRYNLATRDEDTMSKYRVWLKCVNDEATERKYRENLERQLAQKNSNALLTALRCGLPIANVHDMGSQLGMSPEEIDRTQKEFETN